MSDSRSWLKRWTYDVTRISARLAGVLFFRIRCEGRYHVPTKGGALVCANHQSFLDPVLVGLACDRRLNYLARRTLFEHRFLAWLMTWYDAIPLERDGLGLSGMKETLRRLKREEMVLLFPEGTRTTDGAIGELKPGFCALARRSRVPLLPVTLSGAFSAWPRSQRLPRPAPIWIQFGPAISVEEVAALDDEQLIARLQNAWRDCLSRSHIDAAVRP